MKKMRCNRGVWAATALCMGIVGCGQDISLESQDEALYGRGHGHDRDHGHHGRGHGRHHGKKKCERKGGPDCRSGKRHAKEARKLRHELERRDVQPLPDAPEVSQALFDLGQALAFDKILSGNRDISCMTCHHPTLGTDDDRSLPLGVGGVGLGQSREGGRVIPRNSPPLFNLHTYDTMFWDSRVSIDEDGNFVTPAGDLTNIDGEDLTPILEFGIVSAQALFPVTSRDEMRGEDDPTTPSNDLADFADDNFAGIWAALMDRILTFDEYQVLFLAAYPNVPQGELRFAHAANAIAAWEIAAFASTSSPFERFVRGDDSAMTTEQIKGARAFYKTGCGDCHSGNTLSDFDHHNTALAQFGPGKGDGISGRDDFGFERVSGDRHDRYRFRTPPLFNVELTAPYGHVGQHATLKEHVKHYDKAKKSLKKYKIERRVENEDLHDTFLDNRRQVIRAGIDREVRNLRKVKKRKILPFLEALTDPEMLDLTDTLPTMGVPSGIEVD